MKRREFLTATCLAGLAPLSETARAADKCAAAQRDFYELRHYRIQSQDKQQRVLDFLKTAALPALNRIGVKRIGVFTMLQGDKHDLYMLLPHDSLESVVTASSLIASDPEYNKAGASLLNSPKSDPPYERIESSLMIAFDAMPRLELPTNKPSRIFQLRIYESHNSLAGKKKVEMFNTGGEIAIFRRTGLNPVFFGRSLVGTRLPNLTYMLGFDDMDTKEKSWKRFGKDPGWKKLKAEPYYKDTVSNITNILLRPASISQI